MARKVKQGRVRAFFKGMSCPKKPHGDGVYVTETYADNYKGAAESDARVEGEGCLWQPASTDCATQTKPPAECDCNGDQEDLFSQSLEAALSVQRSVLLRNLRNVLLISLSNLVRLKIISSINWAFLGIHLASIKKVAVLNGTGIVTSLLQRKVLTIKSDALRVLRTRTPPLFDWQHFAAIQIVRIITSATSRVYLSTFLGLATPKIKPPSLRKKDLVGKNIANLAIKNFEKQTSLKSEPSEKTTTRLNPHLVSQLDFFTKQPYILQGCTTPSTLGKGGFKR